MDSTEAGKSKEIVWTRRNSGMSENNGAVDPNKCHSNGGEKRRHSDSMQVTALSTTSLPTQQYAMPIVPVPKVDEWCSNSSIILTGTVGKGATGPPVGAVDIGVSKSAYYFCIALPGVKKDPGEFSCEINQDGKVWVRGVTSTGGKTITKYSRVFEMKFQQQCAPGPFSLFFTLPGPVDPRLFSPNFRSDGIFEGVVAKYEQTS